MKIRQCPHCGGKGYMEILHDRQLGAVVCFVKCEVCGAAGMRIRATETGQDFVQAIACWNMRTGERAKYKLCV